MKKILTVAAFVAVGFGAFTACKKSSSSPSYYVKATINGQPFSSSNAFASSGSSSGITLSSIFSYSGSTVSYPFISIALDTSFAVGTFQIDGTNLNTIVLDSSATSGASALYGTITIKKTNPVTGTFSCTLTDSTKVTNGSFVAPLK